VTENQACLIQGHAIAQHLCGGRVTQEVRTLGGRIDVGASSGSYVQITLDIPIDDRGVIIPAETLLFPSGQPAVAVVRADDKVAIQSVTVIRDLGTRLQVSADISQSDQLIRNPSPNLSSGAVVTVVTPPQR